MPAGRFDTIMRSALCFILLLICCPAAEAASCNIIRNPSFEDFQVQDSSVDGAVESLDGWIFSGDVHATEGGTVTVWTSDEVPVTPDGSYSLALASNDASIEQELQGLTVNSMYYVTLALVIGGDAPPVDYGLPCSVHVSLMFGENTETVIINVINFEAFGFSDSVITFTAQAETATLKIKHVWAVLGRTNHAVFVDNIRIDSPSGDCACNALEVLGVEGCPCDDGIDCTQDDEFDASGSCAGTAPQGCWLKCMHDNDGSCVFSPRSDGSCYAGTTFCGPEPEPEPACSEACYGKCVHDNDGSCVFPIMRSGDCYAGTTPCLSPGEAAALATVGAAAASRPVAANRSSSASQTAIILSVSGAALMLVAVAAVVVYRRRSTTPAHGVQLAAINIKSEIIFTEEVVNAEGTTQRADAEPAGSQA